MKRIVYYMVAILGVLFPVLSQASETYEVLQATDTLIGYLCLAIFFIAYVFVILEEKIHLSKSKPVILAAGIIWVLVAIQSQMMAVDEIAFHESVMHNLNEYAALFLFLLVAMTYINVMEERHVFAALRSWLTKKEMTYRKLFWVTGIISFFLSPIADNLTTALIMGAVIMAVGEGNTRFISMGMVNIVVAANSGGAFSPFGDITTLMVWQAKKVEFFNFFALFIPSLVNYIVPAAIMHFFVPEGKPCFKDDTVELKKGGMAVVVLFLITIAMAVSFEKVLSLPPFMGMMTGLALLMMYAYLFKISKHAHNESVYIFNKISRAEWDTLLFFFGIIFSVGGLGYLGYLTFLSDNIYQGLGLTKANILVGLISAVVDNIPVMFAIISMNPQMDLFHWLLVTLTAGVGGSLLSIGSAAGVGLMGSSKGSYTFLSHLKWSWVILLGYAASIATHFLLNSPASS